MAHRQSHLFEQVEYTPDNDLQTEIPPRIVPNVGLGAGIGRCGPALRQAEMFDIEGRDGELLAVRPVVIGR